MQKMKNHLLFFPLLFENTANSKRIHSNPILTKWAELVDPNAPLPEHPNPMMERENKWASLNGQWDYSILPKGEIPTEYEGKITVPYPVESYLSGVLQSVGAEKELWYKREFIICNAEHLGKVLLHFGAVDWESEIFVNGKSVGIHQGGFDPFSFEISSYLTKGIFQEIKVRVWDPTDDGPQPRGKQAKDPNGIWYTPVTGIWQTVWMEFVPENYLSDIRITPDWDNSQFVLEGTFKGNNSNLTWQVKAFDNEMEVAQIIGVVGESLSLKIQNPKSWSPDSPHLYDFEISLLNGHTVVDQVKSYGALRKIASVQDSAGMLRMELNGEVLFQYGPLDQGWWPDGLYTAPIDEALVFDIEKTKELGFNMIRKHGKVEAARWYYQCDKLGMLVWQDMPSGDNGNVWEAKPGVVRKGMDKERTAESAAIFRKEWKAVINALYNYPSIVVWVPFNEAWGQFQTKEIINWTKAYDPTRLVNSASGGNFELEGTTLVGDIFDIHSYPDPAMPSPDLFGGNNILALGEFGGLGLPIEGHTWQERDNWGYQSFRTEEELLERYKILIADLKELIPKGLAAAVYTQTTDVEIEINGLMTYDRQVLKFSVDALRKLHTELYEIEVTTNQNLKSIKSYLQTELEEF